MLARTRATPQQSFPLFARTPSWLIFLGAFFVFIPIASAQPTLRFMQADFHMGSLQAINSNWGGVRLDYTGVEQTQYFSLAVDGQWRIKNCPVHAFSGVGNPTSLLINFNLGNVPGTDVGSIGYWSSFSDSIVSGDAPLNNDSNPVSPRPVTIGGSEGQWEEIPGIPPYLHHDLEPALITRRYNMPNQDVGVMECVPAALSNSLQWLDDTHPEIDIPSDRKDIGKTSEDGLKAITKWHTPTDNTPGTGGCYDSDQWWDEKSSALSQWVKTEVLTEPIDMDRVRQLFNSGSDVEIIGDHHAATVRGLDKNADGTWTIFVGHDTDQLNTPEEDPANLGGLVVEPLEYDPTGGSLQHGAIEHGASGFFSYSDFSKNDHIKQIIIETVVPEPDLIQLATVAVVFIWAIRRR